MTEAAVMHGFMDTGADGWSRAVHYDACFTAEERVAVERIVASLPKVPHEIVVRADGARPFPGWAVEALGGKVEAHITAWGWNPARCDTASFAAIRAAARQLPAKPLRIEVSSSRAFADPLSAVAQLPEELRRVVWRHAVDLYAYFGKPVVQLSREEIALWLGLRAEFAHRVRDACDVRIRVGSLLSDVSADRIREAVGLASKDGDVQSARDAAKVIADAVAPLKPLDLREQVRELLRAYPLMDLLLEIDRELDAYADKVAAQDNTKAVAASRDASAIRKSFAKLSWASQKPRP